LGIVATLGGLRKGGEGRVGRRMGERVRKKRLSAHLECIFITKILKRKL